VINCQQITVSVPFSSSFQWGRIPFSTSRIHTFPTSDLSARTRAWGVPAHFSLFPPKCLLVWVLMAINLKICHFPSMTRLHNYNSSLVALSPLHFPTFPLQMTFTWLIRGEREKSRKANICMWELVRKEVGGRKWTEREREPKTRNFTHSCIIIYLNITSVGDQAYWRNYRFQQG